MNILAENESNSLAAHNASFWNELCGTSFAKSLGVTDDSPASLKRFDDWYFAFYPYLFVHIPFEAMKDKDVLEIGLGYGSVSQRIAEVGARYRGLDIAPGPIWMANRRLQQAGLSGHAGQGSILEPDFADESFDIIVAIGCLHHTGDLQRAIHECHRILRPGGKLVFMVYYAYSYRRFYQARGGTIRYAIRELFGHRGVVEARAERERAAYDANSAGEAAPHTDFISGRSLRRLCQKFSSFSAQTENIDNGTPFEKAAPRRELLKTLWPRLCGLDLYATAVK
jgi:SAM-dependent methyltransferase